MFRYKYKKIKFYWYNLGRFDLIFLLKALLRDNESIKGQNNSYIIDVICRKVIILKIEIKKAFNNKTYKTSILYCYAILTDSLKNLSMIYQVYTIKGDFPHCFANMSNLFYRGNTPYIRYYNNLYSDLYNSMYIIDI